MIENCIINSTKFYLFGAGNTARKVKDLLQSKGKMISAFIVSAGSFMHKIDDIEIVTLAEAVFLDKEITVIIAIFNRESNSFQMDIIRMLKRLGFTNIITFPELHSLYFKELGDCYWLTDKKYYLSKKTNFESVLNLFKDQVSIDIYRMIIAYLLTFDVSLLERPDFDNQYFPKDIDVWNGKDAFYDLGSYDGSNIIDAFNRKGKLEQVIAFEPDLDNFNKIVNNPLILNCTKQLFLYPCGVWSETTILKFNIGSGESSRFTETGSQIVPVVKVDDVIYSKPGYIKFDVEGAEINALMGLRSIITKYKPSLAVSIYHCPHHLYEIPTLIKDWNLGYKFFVRIHGNNLFDTVLYCIQ